MSVGSITSYTPPANVSQTSQVGGHHHHHHGGGANALNATDPTSSSSSTSSSNPLAELLNLGTSNGTGSTSSDGTGQQNGQSNDPGNLLDILI